MDAESQTPLTGVTITLLKDTLPILGTQTGIDGSFRIQNVPIGRITLVAEYLGYTTYTASQLIVTTAKEVVLQLNMQPSGEALKEVEIQSSSKSSTVNDMALISARTFSVSETERYAGSRGDPARMASNYAGVQGANDSRNDLVIRGNTPAGLTYRLEDTDIPNPNHFAVAGTMGGPVSLLNNKVLASSDFLTGAFPAEYGNAISGIFDLKMRTGNNEKHEFSGQLGVLGTELTAEGPISKKQRSSYLVNYRYSTLKLFQAINFAIGTSAVPNYQDASLRLNFPTQKWGTFSLYGIGGNSKIDNVFSTQTKPAENIYGEKDRDQYFRSATAAIGAGHALSINPQTFVKLSISYAPQQSKVWHIRFFKDAAFRTIDSLTHLQLGYRFFQDKATLAWFVNRKLGVRHVLRAGFQLDRLSYDFIDSNYNDNAARYLTRLKSIGITGLIRPYLQIKSMLTSSLTLLTGLHYQYLWLNGSQSLEPRLAIKYKLSSRHALGIGYGLHSQMQPLYVYFQFSPPATGIYNEHLGFTKSHHLIASWDYSVSQYIRLKSEVYYQHLFQIPVTNYPSSFSLINQGGAFSRVFPPPLTNMGTGHNYGLELTAEKFFSANYYFMLTGSVYTSRYRGSDRVLRNTDYNGNFAFNALAGTEQPLGKNKKTVLILGGKLTWAGGRRYGPLDTLASRSQQDIVYQEGARNSLQFKNYLRADLKLGLRANSKRLTHEAGIDLVNIFGIKNILGYTYSPDPSNPAASPLQLDYQLGFLPLIYYRVDW